MTFDLDVILAAHGAGDGSHANARVRRWASELQATEVGARVVAAFHQGCPSYEEALALADRPHRVVIPCLTSDGYHAARLRRAASDATERSGRPVAVTAPVGTSGPIALGIASQVRERVRELGAEASRTLVVIVGHGTARYPSSAAATRELADTIPRLTRARAAAAFLDEFPTVEDAVANPRGYRTILVVPFLFGGGRHGMHDLPARVAAACARRGDDGVRVALLDPLGDASAREAFEAAIDDARFGRTLLRVGASGSALAGGMVEAFARHMASIHVDVRLRTATSCRERDGAVPTSRARLAGAIDGALDAALHAGTVDVTIHSRDDAAVDRPDAVFEVCLSAAAVRNSAAGPAPCAIVLRCRRDSSVRHLLRRIKLPGTRFDVHGTRGIARLA